MDEAPAHRFGSVILVDPRGWLLLQERDEHPVIDPECWGFCGGHLEPGEEPLAGALRELAEESGVRLAPADVVLVAEVPVHHAAYGTLDRAWVYAAPTTLVDAQIEQGEGRRIVFVDPAEVERLPLTTLAALVLPDFIHGPLHRTLEHAARAARPT